MTNVSASAAKPISVEDILAQMRALAAQAESRPVGGGAGETDSFGAMLQQSVEKVSNSQTEARQLADAYQAGTSDASLADVMVALQKASLSFQAMTQVRNKLVSAYQEIMGMQI